MEFIAMAAAVLETGPGGVPWEKLGISGVALFAMKFLYDIAMARAPSRLTGKTNGNGGGCVPTEMRQQLHDIHQVAVTKDQDGNTLSHFPRGLITRQHERTDAKIDVVSGHTVTIAKDQAQIAGSMVDVVKLLQDVKREVQKD